MRRAACALHMQEKRKAYRVLVGNLKERSHLENIGIDGRIRTIFI
jgi:hypothetical protein